MAKYAITQTDEWKEILRILGEESERLKGVVVHYANAGTHEQVVRASADYEAHCRVIQRLLELGKVKK
jgi:hypothetical protein